MQPDSLQAQEVEKPHLTLQLPPLQEAMRHVPAAWHDREQSLPSWQSTTADLLLLASDTQPPPAQSRVQVELGAHVMRQPPWGHENAQVLPVPQAKLHPAPKHVVWQLGPSHVQAALLLAAHCSGMAELSQPASTGKARSVPRTREKRYWGFTGVFRLARGNAKAPRGDGGAH